MTKAITDAKFEDIVAPYMVSMFNHRATALGLESIVEYNKFVSAKTSQATKEQKVISKVIRRVAGFGRGR